MMQNLLNLEKWSCEQNFLRKNSMQKIDIRPELVAFASGALVMIFEILGSRVVGPYIGTSLFVWTSLIAFILGALSLGHYV